MAKATTIKFL